MATEKNSSYKLDFTYKHTFPTLGERKYRVEDIILYRQNWRRTRNAFLRDVHSSYIDQKKENEFWALIDLNTEISSMTRDVAASEIINSITGAITDGKPLNDRYYEYRYTSYVEKLAKRAALKSPEYTVAEAAFNKWLKRRQGVVAAWKQYAEDFNARLNNSWGSYNTTPLSVDIDLKSYADSKFTKAFRATLEKSRPDKFYHGMVVRLKDEYLDKRGKDPFYYSWDQNVKKSERIGSIVDKKGDIQYGAYGEGSRTVKVMWFATGEETAVMEKCLKLEEVSEMPAAANSET